MISKELVSTWIGWLLWPHSTLAGISEWLYSIVVMVVVEVEGLICLPLIDTYSTLFNVYSVLFNPYSKLFDTYSKLFNTYSMLLNVTVPTQLIKMSHVTTPPVCIKFHPCQRSLAWYLNPFEKLQKPLKIQSNKATVQSQEAVNYTAKQLIDNYSTTPWQLLDDYLPATVKSTPLDE
jgi:hypothetical protein